MSGNDEILNSIAGLEVEVVIGGAVQRITFAARTNPGSVPDMLRELDSAAQFRTQFFTGRGGGNRDTKKAQALAIMAEGKNGSKYITITAHATDGEAISIKVGKKKSDSWLAEAIALDRLSAKTAERLGAALEGGRSATAVLTEHERFGVNYFSMDDGAAYLDSMQADPPEVKDD